MTHVKAVVYVLGQVMLLLCDAMQWNMDRNDGVVVIREKKYHFDRWHRLWVVPKKGSLKIGDTVVVGPRTVLTSCLPDRWKSKSKSTCVGGIEW
jgi:hypothetical protein